MYFLVELHGNITKGRTLLCAVYTHPIRRPHLLLTDCARAASFWTLFPSNVSVDAATEATIDHAPVFRHSRSISQAALCRGYCIFDCSCTRDWSKAWVGTCFKSSRSLDLPMQAMQRSMVFDSSPVFSSNVMQSKQIYRVVLKSPPPVGHSRPSQIYRLQASTGFEIYVTRI